MKTGYHWPRCRPIDLLDLSAVVAVVFLVVPSPFSLIVAGFVLVCFLLHFSADRIGLVEWMVLIAIFGVLLGLLLPSVNPHEGRHRRPPPVAPTPPPEPPEVIP